MPAPAKSKKEPKKVNCAWTFGFANWPKSSDMELLESGNLADVKVVCGSRSWNLHQLILTSRCPWFKAALNGSFLEAQTRVINIEEFSPNLVDAVIHYIYSGGELDLSKIREDQKESSPRPIIQSWVVADFFLLEPMKIDSIHQLKDLCETNMGHMLDLNHKVTPTHKKKILEVISSGVTTAYHEYPHAEPCQRLLLEMAFACRLRLYGMNEFIKLVEKECDFGFALHMRCLRSRDLQHHLGTSLILDNTAPFVDQVCEKCRRPPKPYAPCYHIFNDKPSTDKKSAVIRWRCYYCGPTRTISL